MNLDLYRIYMLDKTYLKHIKYAAHISGSFNLILYWCLQFNDYSSKCKMYEFRKGFVELEYKNAILGSLLRISNDIVL